MQDITEKVSYIFRYKEAGEERKQAQLFLLSYLRKCFPKLEIIVVEQGEKQTLFPPKDWNVRLILEEYSGIFNRCRPYNIGAKVSDRSILAFGDGDIFLKKEDYLTCFEATENFEAITPNKNLALNVEIEDPQKHTFKFLNNRRVNTFAGGLVILTRAAFERIGGWDERFIAWGHEDMAMSFLIFQTLKSKTFFLDFYHIDHPRAVTDTIQHADININEVLYKEISTFSGQAMKNYIDILKQQQLGDNPKEDKPKFVLAIVSRRGLENLKKLVASFLETKTSAADWTLIISDKGVEDGVRDWVKNLQLECPVFLIENNEVSFLRRENRLLKKLSEIDFDLCFKSSDEVSFVEKGWDEAYWEVIKKTGYDHLVYYNTKRVDMRELDFPIVRGDLVAHCPMEYLEGLFFTLTPRVIQQVGFMDEQMFSKHEGILDYIFRACRLGFNVLQYPFDLRNSNTFIELQKKSQTNGKNTPSVFKKLGLITQQFLNGNRGYVPYNENDFAPKYHSIKGAEFQSKQFKKPKVVFKKCNITYQPSKSVSGFVGFLIRRLYNFSIDYKFYFIPRKIKSIGKSLMKTGEDLVRIDD